jgi:hypothetical protein
MDGIINGNVNFRKGWKGLLTKYGIDTSEPVKKNSRYIYFEKEGDWINGKMQIRMPGR